MLAPCLPDDKPPSLGCFGWFIIFIAIIITIGLFPVTMFMCIKIVKEYERAVIFRLGRIVDKKPKGPGIFFVLPCTDTFRKVDLRTVTFDIPAQETALDEATSVWGIKVERVEIKDVKLPIQLQRAMAAEAEAAREARAKVIAAEGEMNASRALKEASLVISESPSALQLRYLQTLSAIAAERNSTIIFPVPIDIIQHFTSKKNE
uniref:Band 7 domain-containing protein n=1 Tax=Cyprinus carpio TaxID=7962 RepID=A0A8C2AS07_CYPCA